MDWSAVVPVKRLQDAKSRLYADGSVTVDRRELVLALALDTVRAARAARRIRQVVVVTDEPDAATALTALGARVVPDMPDAGLNPALEYGAAQARTWLPTAGIVVVAGDLAALRPDELDAALVAAEGAARAFIADDTDGTAMLMAAPGVALDPRYGKGSRHAHRQSGAVELTGDWPSLRCDVDTPDALDRARALGLGPATTMLLPPLTDR